MDNELKHYGVLGMKWGVRRYQNKDGSLTYEGQKRYDRDKRENASKKKDNRIDVSKPDPNRWVKEDLERRKKVVSSTSDLIKEMDKLEKSGRTSPKKIREDLSNMSDQEIRQKINRELMEKQYTELFGKEEAPKISKGRQFVSGVLGVAGSTLAVTGSALSIALAIKELRGR